jgi:hypothetical protein
MKFDRIKFLRLIGVHLCSSVFLILLSGCFGKPNQANIELRKNLQARDSDIAALKQTQETDRARIATLESSANTIATLPQDRLDKLITTQSITIGRLTGADDKGLSVYVSLLDRTGDEIKSTGTFTVEAFDLAQPGDNSLGRWTFSGDEALKHWRSALLVYHYVLPCPWQKTPVHSQVTVRVEFVDELTQRKFEAQKVVEVKKQADAPTSAVASP